MLRSAVLRRPSGPLDVTWTLRAHRDVPPGLKVMTLAFCKKDNLDLMPMILWGRRLGAMRAGERRVVKGTLTKGALESLTCTLSLLVKRHPPGHILRSYCWTKRGVHDGGCP